MSMAASKSRKQRLAALKAKRMASQAGTPQSNEVATATRTGSGGGGVDSTDSRKRQRPGPSDNPEPTRSVKFRNYAPTTTDTEKAVVRPAPIQPPSEAVGDRVAGAVAEATAPRDPSEPIKIVQKKIDWDLKRDVAPQLDILEKRTRIAIRELLRQQLVNAAQ